jgi:Fur family ferric uptake transcriptional regulator
MERTTRQRSALKDLLEEDNVFLTARQVHERLRRRGEPVSLSTVYRGLQAMTEAGDLDVLPGSNGEHRYRRCTGRGQPHHHLVCRNCGRAVEITATPVERWATRIAREHGFAEVSHRLELEGACSACPAH